MVFSVRAYEGKPSPTVEITKLSGTETTVSAAKKIDTKWKAETLDARKAQNAKLAKAVVASL